MKSQRIALIALAVASTLSSVAHADDSTITLYGVLDAAVGTVQHSFSTNNAFPATIVATQANAITPGKNDKSLNGMFNGGIQDSRWGIRGKEDMGDGLSAIFTLESGIDLPSGQLNNADGISGLGTNSGSSSSGANSSLSGQLFNRQAWAGVASKEYGAITVGRQYEPMYDILTTYDPVQYAQLFSPLGFSGSLGGGIGVSEELRMDNSVKYAHKLGDFNFAGMYQFGGIAGHNGAGSAWNLRLGYESGPVGIQAAYQRLTDALSAANDGYNPAAQTVLTNLTGGTTTLVNAPNIKVTNQNSVGYLIAAKYHLYDGNIKAGVMHYTLGAPSDAFSTLSVTNLYGTPIASATNLGTDKTFRIGYIGGDYNLTSKFNLAAGYYAIHQDASPNTAAAGAQKAGDQRYYSLLADYNLSKRTDAYAGMMYQNLGGDAFPSTTTYQSNRILALGLRHKF